MIKVGEILKEKEDSERLSIITKIKNDDSLIEVHMIAEDGEVRIITYLDEDTMQESIGSKIVSENQNDTDWLSRIVNVFTKGERTLQSI